MSVYDEATGQSYADIFDSLFEDKKQAADLRLRAHIMIDIEKMVKSWGLTQKEAALKLGIPQPRLNDLLKHKINLFSAGNLITLAEKAGLHYELVLKQAA